jgi:hypothetical protein
MVLNHHKQTQPNLPPTSLILGQDGSSTHQATAAMNMSGFKIAPTGSQQKSTLPQSMKPKQGVASNLSNALKQQNSEFQEVDEFLTAINLAKYKDNFLDNGVEDLEIILELDEKHLEQMSIPLGHKLKIMKRIKDMRREKGMSIPESR